MVLIRVIPTLLLENEGLVKTEKFKNSKYIGDPINAVRIFNVKEADELVILDISSTKLGNEPNYDQIELIVSEAFMPVGYGGGINNIKQIDKLFKIGVEKVIINSAAFNNDNLIKKASEIYGSQSIVVCLDYKKDFFGEYRFYIESGAKKIKRNCSEVIVEMEMLGAGEIILNSIDRDGTMKGYDIDLIKRLTKLVKIPVVASGGAGNIQDFVLAINAGATAVAAGSIFVYQGIHRAVLISYIKSTDLEIALDSSNNYKL